MFLDPDSNQRRSRRILWLQEVHIIVVSILFSCAFFSMQRRSPSHARCFDVSYLKEDGDARAFPYGLLKRLSTYPFTYQPYSEELPRTGRFKQTQRTDNLRLLDLLVFVDLAKAVVGPQVDDQCCQLLVADAAAQLAIERIPGRLLERVFVDVLECMVQLRRRRKEGRL